MFLYKRNNGYYYIYYSSSNGKIQAKSTKEKMKSQALKYLSTFEKELKGRPQNDLPKKPLGLFKFEFLRYSEMIRTAKTIKAYQSTFKYFEKMYSNKTIDSFTNNDIRNYLEAQLTKRSIYSARKDLINIKSFFRYALERKYIKENPCIGIKQYKIPEKQPIYFSKEEYDKLLSVIEDKEMKDLVITAANTGLRLMELLNLSWKQINISRRSIILDNSTHITKSKRIRTIPINNNILNILIEMKSNSKSDKVFSYEGRNADIYTSIAFKKYVIKAELNPKLHFHSLRHSFASWLIQSGISIYIVSKLLGHSDIKTTEIYSHLRNDDLQSAVNFL